MNKLMLTTALVSAVVFAAPARAEMEVKIGGYTGFQAGFFDNDAANSSSRDFQSETEIHVRAKGKADNGLEYGVNLELLASTSDSLSADETSLWLSGSWGKLELGDNDGAAFDLSEAAPFVGIGQVRGSYADFVPTADRGHSASEGPAAGLKLNNLNASDATKIAYTSPRLNGFQAGVSYAPERDNAAEGETVQFSNNTGNHENSVEFGVNYRETFSDVGVRLGAAYVMADAKTGATVNDISAWTLGGQVSYAGFSFGGAYVDNGDSGLTRTTANDDVTLYNLGLTYSAKSWGVGVSYANVDFDRAGVPFGVAGISGSGGDYSAIGFGATYTIAPGLTTGADLVFYDRNRVTGADTDGTVLVTEVRVAF